MPVLKDSCKAIGQEDNRVMCNLPITVEIVDHLKSSCQGTVLVQMINNNAWSCAYTRTTGPTPTYGFGNGCRHCRAGGTLYNELELPKNGLLELRVKCTWVAL